MIIFPLCVATRKLRIKFVAHPQQECRILQALVCVLALFLAPPLISLLFFYLLSYILLGFFFSYRIIIIHVNCISFFAESVQT